MTAHVEYETEARHFAHVDCPGHADDEELVELEGKLRLAIREVCRTVDTGVVSKILL